MILINLLAQLNAMSLKEAAETMDSLTGGSVEPYSWYVTIIRHGKLELAKIFLSASGIFVAEDLAQRNSEIYKLKAIDVSFGEQIQTQIELAVKIESNFKLN